MVFIVLSIFRPKSGGVSSGSQLKQSKSDYVITHQLITSKSAEKESTDNSVKSLNSVSNSLTESGTNTPDRKNGPVIFDIDGSSVDSAKINKSSDLLEKSSNIVNLTPIRRKSPISGSSDKYGNKSCVSGTDMEQKSKGEGKSKVDGKLLEVATSDIERSSKSQDCLLPNTYQSLSSSVNVLVEKRCSSPSNHNLDKESVLRRKKKGLHRSHSDLSCRHSRNSSDFSDISSRLSRTSTELERFFNEMGIDKSVLDPMIKLHEQCRKGSEFWESVSSLNSVSDRKSSGSSVHSQQGDKGKSSDKDLKERTSQSTSIVEKNARIIKWLYNVKKAGHPQQAS